MSQETSDRAEAIETRSDLQRSLHQLELMESYLDMCDRLVDMSDISRFGDENPNSGPAAVGLPDAQLGMSRAYIYPSATSVAYINEVELRWIRARSRAFVQLNPYAAGAVRNRIAYTVGSGHIYKVSPRPNGDAVDATDLLTDCRTILAEFIKKNRWTKRQKETIRRLDRDGERFLRFFPDRDEGCLYVRFIEPLEIQNPPGAAASDGWFFGVRFKKVGAAFDMETAVEYAVTEVNAQGSVVSLKERVPADDVQRLTGNVDLSSPRGLPTFFSFQTHLNNAVQTLKATGKIVEFRARIGMIRRHVNATKETVQRVADRLRQGDQTYDADGSPRVRTAAAYPYAAIIDTSDATDYQFPSAEAPVDKNVAAIQAELRAVAAALAMPEYMLSGDASNANYSSTMVAEGPAVKTFEELQADLIDADVEVMERALCVAAAAGRIRGASGDMEADDYILDLVRVDAEPPIIKSENRMQEVQADKILVDAGVMSLDTFAARHGLEYEGEKEKIAQQPASAPGGEPHSEDDAEPSDAQALVEGLLRTFIRGQPKNAGQFAKKAAVATLASKAAKATDVAAKPPPVRQQFHAAARDAHRAAAQAADKANLPLHADTHRQRAADHADRAKALRSANQHSANPRSKPAATAAAQQQQPAAKRAPTGTETVPVDFGKHSLKTDGGVVPGSPKWRKPWAEPWTRPTNPTWRLPKNGDWSGQRGHSYFKPHKPASLGIEPGSVIAFRRGHPNFAPWTRNLKNEHVPGTNFTAKEKLEGDGKDFGRMYRALAAKYNAENPGAGWTQSAAQKWLSKNKLSPHHIGGNNFQLVPRKLHGSGSGKPRHPGVRHQSGAFDLRERNRRRNHG